MLHPRRAPPNYEPMQRENPSPVPLLRQPLIRLLAVNLAAGVAVAVVMLSGLLALNPANLRDLILADRAGGAALALLMFGFLITFGSAAMGSAIMMLGTRSTSGRPRGKAHLHLSHQERLDREAVRVRG